MGVREFTKSGSFVVMLLVLVAALVPFGLEEIGAATGLFEFPVKKTLANLFSGSKRSTAPLKIEPVDWERYRRDLEDFANWADGQNCAVISPPALEVVIMVRETEKKPGRKLWHVPVTSCTAGDPDGGKRGYVFISGFDRSFEESAMVTPSETLCGYEIVHVSERSVWFRAVFDTEGDVPMGSFVFPDFTRVDGETIVRGKRRYVARDAFPLMDSGGWLMIDSFMPPDGAVFKILDRNRCAIATILCIVIGEKGGK